MSAHRRAHAEALDHLHLRAFLQELCVVLGWCLPNLATGIAGLPEVELVGKKLALNGSHDDIWRAALERLQAKGWLWAHADTPDSRV